MSSLNMFLAPATAVSSANPTGNTIAGTTNSSLITTRARRVRTFATAAKGSGKSSEEEKGIFEWLMGALDKEGLLETDPILQKVEGKSGGTTTVTGKRGTGTVTTAPPKKSEGGFGGFGGLFAKK
ncbi:hypothetical protein SSX86_026411 [Deinandra increscens subsp. villosa]|uniref:Thylakoid soluble phosphoprotein TSP9 n=1 Tax=Deinandra increscens subsp. villosa TaxID=3103831 RepID=A0AAP0CL24_9ASTR